MIKNKNDLENFWKVTKTFFDRQKEFFVSNLMVLSTNELENITGRFVLYHRKNQ